MAIKINKNPAPPPMEHPPSPHGKAAEALVAVTTETTTEDGSTTETTEMLDPGPLPETAAPTQTDPVAWITAGCTFKLPIAPYTMMGFKAEITIASPASEADDSFDAAYAWAEAKISDLVEKQQQAMETDEGGE